MKNCEISRCIIIMAPNEHVEIVSVKVNEHTGEH